MDRRTKNLNTLPLKVGTCVVYVMSRDQRCHDNFALLAAQATALEQKLPVVILFNLLPSTGARARQHYEFMLAGLTGLELELNKYNISLLLSYHNTASGLAEELARLSPAKVYFDFSPLLGPTRLCNKIAKKLSCAVAVVDTHNIIPVWEASDKEEFAAHTFRRKVHLKLDDWLAEPAKLTKHPYTAKRSVKIDWSKAKKLAAKLESNGTTLSFESGSVAAQLELADFMRARLKNYSITRNDPNIDGLSNLSPYLHFGQIASLRIALELTKEHAPLLIKEPKLAQAPDSPSIKASTDVFLEELIVRKELSDNFCYFNQKYKSLEGARGWAKKSLSEHEHDDREYLYSLKDLEDSNTHDGAWNAAQSQLAKTGKMHGYMRMYWAKKILEWSESPSQAVEHANYLNDHYSIDGGDPNGYVGVLWSIAGLHDRAWFERDVFGKIRFMNYNGLKNKFDIKAYQAKWTSTSSDQSE